MKHRWARKKARERTPEALADEQHARAQAFFAENHKLVLEIWAKAAKEGFGTDVVVVLMQPEDEAAKACAEVFKTELRGPTVVALETAGCVEWLERIKMPDLAAGMSELAHFPNIAFVVVACGQIHGGALRNAARQMVPST